MNGWIKRFADGNQEVGTDYAVRHRVASWSKGRLDGMVGALVSNGHSMAVLEGPGDYWQSDDFEVSWLAGEEPRRMKRRVQRKILSEDANIFIEKSAEKLLVRCRVLPTGKQPVGEFIYVFPIKTEHINKWLTLELDEHTSEISMRFTEDIT